MIYLIILYFYNFRSILFLLNGTYQKLINYDTLIHQSTFNPPCLDQIDLSPLDYGIVNGSVVTHKLFNSQIVCALGGYQLPQFSNHPENSKGRFGNSHKNR